METSLNTFLFARCILAWINFELARTIAFCLVCVSSYDLEWKWAYSFHLDPIFISAWPFIWFNFNERFLLQFSVLEVSQHCYIRRKTSSGPYKNCPVFYILSTKSWNVNCPKKLFALHISRQRRYSLHKRSFTWNGVDRFSGLKHCTHCDVLKVTLCHRWYSTEIFNEYRGEN